VLDLLELVERLGADPLGRRVGRLQVGVLGLERPQLVEQRVVVGVRYLGIVEDVVAVVVMLERASQLGGSLGRLLRRRGGGGAVAHTSRAAGRSRRSRSNVANSSTPA
jgi:hypothetical protein